MEFCIIFSDEVFNISGGFVVEAMKLGSVATDAEKLVDVVIDFEEFAAVPRFDGIGFDVVWIDGVENHNVIVASVGGDREASCLIGEQLTLDLDHGHEYHVGFVIVGCLCVLDHVIVDWGCLSGR